MLITSRYFWVAMVFILSFSMLLFLYRRFFLEKGHLIHKVMLPLYALYIGALFVLILFPTYMLRPFRFSVEKVNLIPFKSLRRLYTNPKEPIGNLLLFMPYGFFSVLNDRVPAGRRLLNVLWRTALISTVMEILQLFIGRVTDIDDVIINTLGGLLGGLACVVWHKTRLDHTNLGERIMPELPKHWRGKLAIPLFSTVMLILYGFGLFAVNAQLTRYTGTECSAVADGRRVTFAFEASNGMLWDCTEEKAIFEKDVHAAVYPASTMKLVTCITALDILKPDDPITVGTEILNVPFDCSRAGIGMGNTYTVRELIAGAMLPSGADACYTLGATCGRILLGNPDAPTDTALEAFIDAANEKLKSIGAVHTTMLNVEGLDQEGQLTTVDDLRRVAAAVLNDPLLSEICATEKMEIGPENNRILLKNTNQIVCTDSSYYSPSFTGIKTGSTSLAGNCLIGAFRKDGKEYITIVMHSGYDGKFTDTLNLAALV